MRYILCITAEKIPSNKKTIHTDNPAFICTNCYHSVYPNTEELEKYFDEDTGYPKGWISFCFECHKRRR